MMENNSAWLKLAEGETLETLPLFIKEIIALQKTKEEFTTALAACAIGALHSALKESGLVLSEEGIEDVLFIFLRHWWNLQSSPYLRFTDFEAMLIPGSDADFDKTIPEFAWKNVQSQAKAIMDNLHNPMLSDLKISVMYEQWLQKIIDGEIPYGYRIEE